MEANFARTPKTGIAQTGTAQTAIGAFTNAVLLLTAGAYGAVVTRLDVKPHATLAAATPALLYRSTDGTSISGLIRGRSIAAVTVSTSAAPAETDFGYSESAPLRLQASEKLYVGQFTAATLDWWCEAADFVE